MQLDTPASTCRGNTEEKGKEGKGGFLCANFHGTELYFLYQKEGNSSHSHLKVNKARPGHGLFLIFMKERGRGAIRRGVISLKRSASLPEEKGKRSTPEGGKDD